MAHLHLPGRLFLKISMTQNQCRKQGFIAILVFPVKRDLSVRLSITITCVLSKSEESSNLNLTWRRRPSYMVDRPFLTPQDYSEIRQLVKLPKQISGGYVPVRSGAVGLSFCQYSCVAWRRVDHMVTRQMGLKAVQAAGPRKH